MKPKLTPWFDGRLQPYRPGVYQRTFSLKEEPFYSVWSGKYWYFMGANPDQAVRMFNLNITSGARNLPWRGVQE